MPLPGHGPRPLAVALELEAEQGTDDPSEILSLVVESDEVSTPLVLGHEEEVEDPDRPTLLQSRQLRHDPAFEVRLRAEPDGNELDWSNLRHRIASSSVGPCDDASRSGRPANHPIVVIRAGR